MKDMQEIFRILILHLLSHKEMHGYAIMGEIARIIGFKKKPSSGAIYPLLSKLREEGLIEITKEGKRGKKVYRITESGRKFLESRSEDLIEVAEKVALMRELISLGFEDLHEALELVRSKIKELDGEKKKKISEIVKRTAMEIRYVVEFDEL